MLNILDINVTKWLTPTDGILWRSYRGRFLKVVRSDDEVRELLTRYHDNNNHAGRSRAVREIMVCLNESEDRIMRLLKKKPNRINKSLPPPAADVLLGRSDRGSEELGQSLCSLPEPSSRWTTWASCPLLPGLRLRCIQLRLPQPQLPQVTTVQMAWTKPVLLPCQRANLSGWVTIMQLIKSIYRLTQLGPHRVRCSFCLLFVCFLPLCVCVGYFQLLPLLQSKDTHRLKIH